MTARSYFDWNATTPLRPEARMAMIAALDVVGNPSSVHAEGRAAKALMERSRAILTEALGATQSDIVFTSGATEAAALACAGRDLVCAEVEHEAVSAWCRADLEVGIDGQVFVPEPARSALQLANAETGVIQTLPQGLAVSDLTQGFGKLPLAFDWLGCDMGIVSAHKIGGPRGIGALAVRRGLEIAPQIRGGGQESGRRAGTENLAAIAGFAAAAQAALHDLSAGVWERVAELRNILDQGLSASGFETISVGKAADRLPNTLCLISPGWKGETQVMQMDLAGFAISAGSACSSGRVQASRVLRAMGFGEEAAASAIRLSLGPATTEDEVLRLIDAWGACARRQRQRAGKARAQAEGLQGKREG